MNESQIINTEPPDLASVVMMDQEDDKMKRENNLLSMSKDHGSTHFQCHACNSKFSKFKKLLHHCTVEHEKSLFDCSIAKLKPQLHDLVPFHKTKCQKVEFILWRNMRNTSSMLKSSCSQQNCIRTDDGNYVIFQLSVSTQSISQL